jgi:hypothetical protein
LPKVAKPLTALEVKRLDSPGLHAVGTVPGLYLRVLPTPSCAKMWTLRLVVGDKRRDIGLGGYPAVTLAQALETAREKRQAVLQGRDPVVERRAVRSAMRASQQRQMTFVKAAEGYIPTVPKSAPCTVLASSQRPNDDAELVRRWNHPPRSINLPSPPCAGPRASAETPLRRERS